MSGTEQLPSLTIGKFRAAFIQKPCSSPWANVQTQQEGMDDLFCFKNMS